MAAKPTDSGPLRVGVELSIWHCGSMDKSKLFEAIESRDRAQIIRIVDEAFKAAAREASCRAHALGISVVDGRVEEERRGKPVKRAQHDLG